MVGRHFSALALLLSCASAPLHANASPVSGDCWQGSELDALKVQRFKTMLLVSMLNCRDQEPGIGLDYNRFIRANRDLIARNQSVVRQHFIRTRGPAAGLNAYSEYETALGNQFSNADFTPERCSDAAAELREAGYVSERGLIDMMQSVPEESDVAVCGAEPRYSERRTEFAPAVAEPAPVPPQMQAQAAVADDESSDLAAIEPEGPARAVDPDQVRMAEAAPPPPVPMPERASEPTAAPVQVAVADVPKPIVPAPQAPDRVKAVRDAAKALREALAALETEEGVK